jgi:hypothetical protein
MRIIVKKGENNPPLLDTSEATSIEIRDDEGYLARAIMIIPNSASMLTVTRGDDDFDEAVEQFRLKEKV